MGFARPIVELRDVYFRYDGSREWTLEEVTLELEAGKAVGLVGPNGGGKTTLLKLIAGLLRPQRGEVLLFGREAWRLGRRGRGRLGYVPQRPWPLDPAFPGTAWEVLRASLGGVPPERLEAALRAVGLWEQRHRPLRELSVGQQQRLALARALARTPDLLLLDEPTSALDPAAREDFFRVLGELRRVRPDLAVVLVSHDLERGIEWVDRWLRVHRRVEPWERPGAQAPVAEQAADDEEGAINARF